MRANDATYVNKALKRGTMKRSQLEKRRYTLRKELKNPFKNIRNKKNCCSRLYKREQKRFFLKFRFQQNILEKYSAFNLKK